MIKVERAVVQRGSARDTADALLAYARTAGLRGEVDPAGGAAVLRGGEPLAFNLNALRRTLRIEGIAGPEAVLTVTAEADALPWEGPRVRRALAGHVDALVRHLEGDPSDAVPFAFCAAPAATGTPAVLGGILLSGLFAVLAAMLVMGAYGLIHVNGAAARLAAQGARIEALGEIPVPTVASLAAMTAGDRIAAALFFAVSLGWLTGGLLALAWGLGELVPRWSGLGVAAVLFVLIECLLFLVPAGPLLPAILAMILLPAAARIGYGIPWSFRRAIPAASGVPSPRPRTIVAVAGGFAALAVAVGIAFYALPGLHADPAKRNASTDWEESAAGFRDRVLLGTGWGRALADFYYRNTLLPAEVIRRPRRAQQRVALVLGDPGPLTVSSRLGKQWRFFPTRELGATWFYAEEAATPEDLAARLRPPPEVVFWIVGTGTPEQNPFYAPLKAERDAAARLVIVGGPASLAAPAGPFAGARHVPLPVRPERMADAIGEVLDDQDRAGGLRQLLGAANLSLVLGAGLLLAGLIVWSAWAWGALGAASAIGPWTRRAAWIAGPATALAGWGALALAAAAGGGGLCPPPTPLADPVKALTSTDVCDRLSATQQIVRDGTRNQALRTPEARSILLATLGDGDPRVRFWAAAALGATYHRQAVSPLVARLRDPDLRVRYRAARSLGLLGDRIAIEPLREMMRTDAWYAANYARTALRRIGVLRGSAR